MIFALFELMLYIPANNFLVMSVNQYLAEDKVKCLAEGHNTVLPERTINVIRLLTIYMYAHAITSGSDITTFIKIDKTLKK